MVQTEARTRTHLERGNRGFDKSIATMAPEPPEGNKPNKNNASCGCLVWLLVFLVIGLVIWQLVK